MSAVLVVGDSLTAGTIGSPYTGFLRELHPGDRLFVRGKNNDTLLGAGERAERFLSVRQADVVVLVIGVNDILLPTLSHRRGLWSAGVRLLVRLGAACRPEPGAFRESYLEVLERLRRRHPGPIVIATLTCLGEDLGSELNRRRAEFNDQIRELAGRAGVQLADLGRAFDEVLARLPHAPNPQLLRYDALVINVLRTRLGLPPRNGVSAPYRLTVDGVHLNARGARLVAQTIAAQLEAAQGQAAAGAAAPPAPR